MMSVTHDGAYVRCRWVEDELLILLGKIILIY